MAEVATGSITFQSESLASVWDEALPLMRENNRETGAFSGWDFAPAKEKLQQLENAGFLRLYTSRKDGKLIGYQLFFVMFSINYPGQIIATCQVAYVVPEERGTYSAGKFLIWADQRLADEGVHSIARQSTVKYPLGKVYGRLGYRCVEENWVKECFRGPLAGGPYDGY